jgi:hypothetical protein
VILASTLALFTLATDASFDIDISAPDGVHIPRSERYRQLMDIIAQRKEQYKEMCTMLGIGMYKVEIYTLRRISRMTNKLVPVYQPQEIDDRSLPTRLYFPIPNYGASNLPSTVLEHDLNVYAGDDFSVELQFGFDLSTFTPKAQVRWSAGESTQLLKEFVVTKATSVGGSYPDTLVLQLPGEDVEDLPQTSFYDVQLTSNADKTKTYIKGRVYVQKQVSQ